MFGSQALETAIGLVLMFFVLATAVSAAIEAIAQLTKKRSKDLVEALSKLLSGKPKGSNEVSLGAPRISISQTDLSGLPASFQAVLDASASRAKSSYLSAKAFADLATELFGKVETGALADEVRSHASNLHAKMDALANEAQGDLLEIKSGLERWFDETMSVVQDSYARWANKLTWLLGLVLVLVLNASALTVASNLWHQSVTRDAVIAAAEQQVDTSGEGCDTDGLDGVSCTVDQITTLGLPLGWGAEQRPPGVGNDDEVSFQTVAAWSVSHLVGWALTVLLLFLGAPFWFDLLSKLVSMRAAGTRPDSAAEDPASATARLAGRPVLAEAADLSHRGPGAAMPPGAAGPPGFADVDVDVDVDKRTWLDVALNRSAPLMRVLPELYPPRSTSPS